MNDARYTDAPRVLAALTALHRAYPLERRLHMEACDDTRETYLAVLLRWTQTGAAPTLDGFDHAALDELIALDALMVLGNQIDCPPFSVAVTHTRAHFPHATLHVRSALDALALPRLLQSAASIESRCALSGEPLRFSMTASGQIRADGGEEILLGFQKVSDQITRYAFDLAPGMRFVQARHAATVRQTLSLDEAALVANAFYSFQRKLLNGD